MARGVGYDSLAALVDYLQQEEEDRTVPLSAVAEALQQGALGPVEDLFGAEGVAQAGRMAAATPAGVGKWVTEDIPALVDLASPLMQSSTQRQQTGREAGGRVREGLSALADLVQEEGAMGVTRRGMQAMGEGMGQQMEERGFAALAGPEDVAGPFGKVLAALGMAVGPMGKMGKARRLLSDVGTEVDYKKTAEYMPGQRISTRYPTAKSRTEDPIKENLIIDTDVMRRDDELVSKMSETMAEYPNIQKEVAKRGDPEEIIEAMKEHDKSNLDFIFEQMPPEIRERSMQWYDGANQIANQFGQRYDVIVETASGVLAALSPQMDWFKNVNLAERVLDTVKNQQRMPWTSEMEEFLTRKFYKKPKSEKVKDWRPAIDAIRGKSLQDIQEPVERALWVRAFDETMRDRGYRIVTPEGDFGNIKKTKDGKNAGAGWGSFSDIAKAISVIDDPSIENISSSMGLQHKVRNFYNNIADPNAPYGDVTMDTHAIAGSLLRPLSGKSREVAHNLGSGPSSSVLGVQGTYPIHADAYREAASGRGMLPRQMQSVTWEGVRGMFSPEAKRNEGFVDSVNDLFVQYRNGKLPLEDLQQAVLKISGGIEVPDWAKTAASPVVR